MPKPRTWILLGAGCFALLVGAALILVGASAYYFTRHVQVQPADPDAALAEFETIRGRFAGETPLFDYREGAPIGIAEFERRRATYAGPLPDTLRLVVWDKDERQLVRITLPFWLLQIRSGGALKVDIEGVDLESLGITANDVRLAGPALLLDVETSRNRILLWTE